MLSRIGPAAQRRIDQLLAAARQARKETLAPPATHVMPPHLDGDLLFAYWEHTLDPESREAAEEHALGCESCLGWLLEVGRLFEK